MEGNMNVRRALRVRLHWASKLRLKWKVCEFWRLQQLKSVDKLITLILSELNLPRVCSNSPANGAQGGRAALVTDALLRDKQRKLTKGTICQVKEPVSVVLGLTFNLAKKRLCKSETWPRMKGNGTSCANSNMAQMNNVMALP